MTVCDAVDPLSGAVCNKREDGEILPHKIHRSKDAEFEFTWSDVQPLRLVLPTHEDMVSVET